MADFGITGIVGSILGATRQNGGIVGSILDATRQNDEIARQDNSQELQKGNVFDFSKKLSPNDLTGGAYNP